MLHVYASRTKTHKPRIQAQVLFNEKPPTMIPLCELELNNKSIEIHSVPQLLDRNSYNNFISSCLPYPLNQLNLLSKELYFLFQEPINKSQSQLFWREFIRNPQTAQVKNLVMIT